MKGGKQPLGYTIVEVLIVMAVSGSMFVLAANFINGRQARTSFQQGTNELASRMQGMISDVIDGHYSDIPFNCQQSGLGPLIFPPGSPSPGASDCVFMGKLLHFQPNASRYEVLSLAGAREKALGGGIVTNLSDAQLTLIGALRAEEIIPQSLTIRRVNITDQDGTFYGNTRWSIGFMQGLGVPDATGASYSSGAPTVAMIYSQGVDASTGIPTPIGQVNNRIAYASRVSLCLTDGVGGTRFSRLSIGANNNSQIDVQTRIVATPALCEAP